MKLLLCVSQKVQQMLDRLIFKLLFPWADRGELGFHGCIREIIQTRTRRSFEFQSFIREQRGVRRPACNHTDTSAPGQQNTKPDTHLRHVAPPHVSEVLETVKVIKKSWSNNKDAGRCDVSWSYSGPFTVVHAENTLSCSWGEASIKHSDKLTHGGGGNLASAGHSCLLTAATHGNHYRHRGNQEPRSTSVQILSDSSESQWKPGLNRHPDVTALPKGQNSILDEILWSCSFSVKLKILSVFSSQPCIWSRPLIPLRQICRSAKLGSWILYIK